MAKGKKKGVAPQELVRIARDEPPAAAQQALNNLVQGRAARFVDVMHPVIPVQAALATKEVTRNLRRHLENTQAGLPDQKLVEWGKLTASKLYAQVTTTEQFTLLTRAIVEIFKSFSQTDLERRLFLKDLFLGMMGMLSSRAKEVYVADPSVVDAIFSSFSEEVRLLFSNAKQELERSEDLSRKAQKKGEIKSAKDPEDCYRLCRNLLLNLKDFYCTDGFLVGLLNEDKQAETRDVYRYNLGSVLFASGLIQEAKPYLLACYEHRLSLLGADHESTKKVKAKLDQCFLKAHAPSSPRLMAPPREAQGIAAPAPAPEFH